MLSIDMLEEVIEAAEGGFGEGGVCVFYPVKRQVAVHGGHE